MLPKRTFLSCLRTVVAPSSYCGPRKPSDKDKLTAWCNKNMRKTGNLDRWPPPGCQKADLGIIVLQIPQHTVASLAKAYGALTKVFGQELNAAQIHMGPACHDEYAIQIASGGIEVLYVDSRQMNDRCFREIVL